MRLPPGGNPLMMRPVTNRDSAFLWETEVLRSARRPARTIDRGERVLDNGGDWLTIREAAETTGVPSSTIRKWARHENIPSYLEKTEDGYLRIVSMSGIKEWADEIGRDVDIAAEATGEHPESVEIDLSDTRDHEPEIPEGTMLVPLDAWNKMLNQLGNLHEAGQQLAEARERAAKAETEAMFLRERLRELREEMRPRAERDAPPEPESAAEERGRSAGSLVRKIYTDWRRNRRK